MNEIVVMPNETGFGGYIRDPKAQELIDKWENLRDEITIMLALHIAKNCCRVHEQERPHKCAGCRKYEEVFYHPDVIECNRHISKLMMLDSPIIRFEGRLLTCKPFPEFLTTGILEEEAVAEYAKPE